jgi:hypothetical protein
MIEVISFSRRKHMEWQSSEEGKGKPAEKIGDKLQFKPSPVTLITTEHTC